HLGVALADFHRHSQAAMSGLRNDECQVPVYKSIAKSGGCIFLSCKNSREWLTAVTDTAVTDTAVTDRRYNAVQPMAAAGCDSAMDIGAKVGQAVAMSRVRVNL